MKMEDIKKEYPSIPDDIHQMMEAETDKQIKLAEKRSSESAGRVRKASGRTSGSFRKKRWTPWRIAAAVLIGVLATGTVAYAGTRLYQLRLEKQGNYGLDMELVAEETADQEAASTASDPSQASAAETAEAAKGENNEAAGAQEAAETISDQPEAQTDRKVTLPDTLEQTQIVFGYIPEGMEQSSLYQLASSDGRALSVISFLYDEGDPDQVMHLTNVIESETFESAAKAAVYTKLSDGRYDQRAYLFFADQFRVLMLMAKDLSKEDVIRTAAALSLEGTGENIETADFRTWSDEIRDENRMIAYETPSYLDAMATRYASMPEGKVHQIGESFPMLTSATINGEFTETDALLYRVDQAEVFSDISVLDPAYLSSDKEISDFAREDGTLLPAELHFYSRGDGINCTMEEVYQTSVDTKLLYVTLTLENTGDADMENVLLYGDIRPYLSRNGFDQIDGTSLTEEAATYLNGIAYKGEDLYQGDFDLIRTQFNGHWGPGCPLQYYDFSSIAVGDGTNHIPLIPAGESVTVHLGYLVSDDMLPYIYLDLGSWEYPLQNGIDLRQ
ncbi:MAG: hypothetical protein J6P72_10295 [Firmicutes bacterium]|nr:hypothetical protein [Bacillota bacterium]